MYKNLKYEVKTVLLRICYKLRIDLPFPLLRYFNYEG